VLTDVLSPVDLRLSQVWSKRVVAEHQATSRFAGYAARLETQRVPSPLLIEMEKASVDERRHLDLCLAVVRRFSDAPIDLPVQHVYVHSSDDAEQLLTDVVAACCFSETLNVSVLTASLEAASDTGIQQTTRELLADEVDHSRLGWAYLAWAHRQGQGDSLGEQLPRMLASVTLPLLFADTPPLPEEAALLELGDLPVRARRELFFQTVNQVILPGLEAQGIPVDRAREWLAQPSW
jgi:hypothetical protein